MSPCSRCALHYVNSVGAVLLSALAGASFVQAAEPLYPGAQPKMSAGAGQTVSRGSSSLFYNPANLVEAKFFETDLDVSFLKATYTYQHTASDQYNQVIVPVTAPTATVGISLRPTPSLGFGLSVLPTGTGSKQEVDNVPLMLLGATKPQIVNVSTAVQSMKVAGGLAFRAADVFTVGAGVVYGTEKERLLVALPGSDPFVDALYSGTSMQFVGGVRSELIDRALVIGLSYKTAVTEKYAGTILINPANDPSIAASDFAGVNYIPAAIGFGAEGRFSSFGLFVDLVHTTWSAGRLIAKRGIGPDASAVDYVDTNNIAFGAKFWLAPKHMLEIAAASDNANIGTGTPTTTSTGLDTTGAGSAAGPTFGDLNAIPVQIFSGGYRYRLQGTGYASFAGMYQTGTRVIPPGYGGEGTYTLQIINVMGAIAYGF